MKAAVIVEDAQGKRLDIQDVPAPTLEGREVLIRVRAAGLNRADLSLSAGHFRKTGGTSVAQIAGLELAGEVTAVGDNVEGVAVGDRVMGMGSGAYAEYARLDHRLCIPVPASMRWEQAAALPVGLMTMHDAIVTNGRLVAGESVLVQGVTSGVGLVAFQIALAKGGRPVMGTSTSDKKLDDLRRAGLEIGINSRTEDVVARVQKATNGHGANLIVDMVGGPVININMEAAAIKGRIINVGRMGGQMGEIDLNLHSLKRIALIGVTFRTRSVEEIHDIIRRMVDDLWPDVTAGNIRLPVDRTFPLSDASEALGYMRANAHLGKIVLMT